MRIIQTREPLLVSPNADPADARYYILPVGTVLYVDGGMAEGHVQYHAYFYHKGDMAHEEVPPHPKYGFFIDPVWLWNISAGDLAGMFKAVPISKKDIVTAVKSNNITREDLIEIIKSLPK